MEPTNSTPRNIQPCCEALLREKLLLENALEKERNRRRRITIAFNKLLQAYRCVIDMSNLLNLSTTISSDFDDDKGLNSSDDFDCCKENFVTAHSQSKRLFEELNARTIERVQPSTVQSRNNKDDNINSKVYREPEQPARRSIFKSRICVLPNNNDGSKSSPMRTAISSEEIYEPLPSDWKATPRRMRSDSSSFRLPKPMNNDRANLTPVEKNWEGDLEVVLAPAAPTGPESRKSNGDRFFRPIVDVPPPADLVPRSRISDHPTTTQRPVSSDTGTHKETEYRIRCTSRRSSEWYFLPLNDELDAHGRSFQSRDGLKRWLRNSSERQRQIIATSQRRAQIAAARRSVAVDLLCGRRALDDDALRVLHTDSSSLSSFPPHVMRQMRLASKKKYRESQIRLDRESGNPREKHLRMATNKILAHASATITKCITSHVSREAGTR